MNKRFHYWQGWWAFHQLDAIEDCPYVLEYQFEERRDWRAGWIDAAREVESA